MTTWSGAYISSNYLLFWLQWVQNNDVLRAVKVARRPCSPAGRTHIHQEEIFLFASVHSTSLHSHLPLRSLLPSFNPLHVFVDFKFVCVRFVCESSVPYNFSVFFNISVPGASDLQGKWWKIIPALPLVICEFSWLALNAEIPRTFTGFVRRMSVGLRSVDQLPRNSRYYNPHRLFYHYLFLN